MKDLILAIDQGTTSSRAILFDKDSNVVATSQVELGIIYPASGWIEQSAAELWESVMQVLRNVLLNKNYDKTSIKAIGITNQRETTILWNKETGEPLYNAIVWQSRQSQDICEELSTHDNMKLVRDKTGLLINPYFSATKIKWIIDNVKGVKELIKEKKVLFGTVDTYLLWKLTKGKLHLTDYTNASRTMLFNIHTLEWDKELLELFDIDESILPKVVNSSDIYGEATALHDIDENLHINVASMVGDQQASLFGQCCYNVGDVKNTYGTGCFMLMNIGDKAKYSSQGLLTTIAWGLNGKISYALEGSVFIGGSAVQWLRDGLKMITKSSDVENYSNLQNIPSSNGIYVVPAFVGLGTPYWDNDARGAIFGLTRATSNADIINATVESIAYQSKDVMEVMKEDSGFDIKTLAVDGGASVNDYLIQFQSDLLNCKIVRPTCLETTALGAAYMAGLAVGVYKNLEELKSNHMINKVFMPRINNEKREELYKGWKKAIKATREYK